MLPMAPLSSSKLQLRAFGKHGLERGNCHKKNHQKMRENGRNWGIQIKNEQDKYPQNWGKTRYFKNKIDFLNAPILGENTLF